MDVSVNREARLPNATSVQTQTSTNSSENAPKHFDPELLKDEKAVHSAAREFAQATSPAEPNAATTTPIVPRHLQHGSAEWSRQDTAPNWSNYSAASKGYTFTERAINRYRHIGALA